jgi:hypothetical protein
MVRARGAARAPQARARRDALAVTSALAASRSPRAGTVTVPLQRGQRMRRPGSRLLTS